MTDPSISSVHVWNLNRNTTEAAFVGYFRTKCAGVKQGSDGAGGNIARDNVGRSRGFGFIHFVDPFCAHQAVARKDLFLDGRRLYCQISTSTANIRAPRTPSYLRGIYVGNLNVSTTKEEFEEYFQKFGAIVRANITTDEEEKSKSFGFVEFEDSSSVNEVQNNRPHTINHKEVHICRQYPRNVPLYRRKSTTVLFVSNNGRNIDVESIEQYFSTYGTITSASADKVTWPDIPGDFEYVRLEFDDYDAVDKICVEEISRKHEVNGSVVQVKKCLQDYHDERVRVEPKNRADDDDDDDGCSMCDCCCLIL